MRRADDPRRAAADAADLESTTGPVLNGGPAMGTLELVVAIAENDVIGRDNGLPWRLPADLRHFKALTLGRTLLMGRKTYESIGHALPGRTNLVLTRSSAFQPGDCSAVSSVADARRRAGAEPLMVIGGSEVYRQCIALATRIHLTRVHAQVDGNTFFSEWRRFDWRESSREHHEPDDHNRFAYSFITLERDRTAEA